MQKKVTCISIQTMQALTSLLLQLSDYLQATLMAKKCCFLRIQDHQLTFLGCSITKKDQIQGKNMNICTRESEEHSYTRSLKKHSPSSTLEVRCKAPKRTQAEGNSKLVVQEHTKLKCSWVQKEPTGQTSISGTGVCFKYRKRRKFCERISLH